MKNRPGFTLAIACIAVIGVSACGTTQRSSDAAAVVDRFYRALAQQEGEAACAELIKETESKLERQERKPCRQAILDLRLPRNATATTTSVYVTSASVLTTPSGTTFLDESADGWEISAAGCKRAAPDMPYDCALEG
jgi:hypothetical protein